MTQPQLAEKIGVHVAQVRRYEAGTSQPTLDVIRSLAVAFGVSADELLFAEDERGPSDDLKLQFEAVSRFDPEAKKVVQQVLDSMILPPGTARFPTEPRPRYLIDAARAFPGCPQGSPARPYKGWSVTQLPMRSSLLFDRDRTEAIGWSQTQASRPQRDGLIVMAAGFLPELNAPPAEAGTGDDRRLTPGR